MTPKNVRIFKPKSTEEWLNYKKQSIGGSEIAAICGLNQWTTPLDIWYLKTGQKEFPEMSLPMKRGKFFESALVELWENETGHRLIKSSAKDILYINKEYPFYLLHLTAGFSIKTEEKEHWRQKPLFRDMKIQWICG